MTMTASPIRHVDPTQRDTDTILRLGARDLFITLSLFSRNRKLTTLENIRLRLCLDRKKTVSFRQTCLTLLYNVAEDSC